MTGIINLIANTDEFYYRDEIMLTSELILLLISL